MAHKRPTRAAWIKAQRAAAQEPPQQEPPQQHGRHYANLTSGETRGSTSPAAVNVSAVTTARLTGGKRKGKSMRRTPRETLTGNITAADIERALAIDSQAQAHVNGRGVVKMLTYRREG